MVTQDQNLRISEYQILSVLCLLFSVFCSCGRRIPTEAENFNLPSVYLYIDRDNLEILNSNIFSKRYVYGRFIHEEREYKVKIRYHGYFGRLAFKKSYKVKFDTTDLFENQEKIILSSQAFDPSLLRYHLSRYLFCKAGLMVSEVRFVSLFINGEYKGIYCLIEHVDEYFFRNRGEEVGHFYKAYSGLADFTFKRGYDLRVGFEKKPQDDGNYSDLEYLIYVLDTTPTDELKERLEELLDVKSYIAYLAISTLISNWDGFYKNFYLHDPGRFEIIPWDFDRTFQLDRLDYTIYGENNLSKRVLEVEEYLAYYKNLLLELMEEEFSDENMWTKIDSLSDYIREAYQKDPFLISKNYNLDEEAQKIKYFIQNRRAYVQEQLR